VSRKVRIADDRSLRIAARIIGKGGKESLKARAFRPRSALAVNCRLC
jgi:hypothetical protein